MSEHFNHKIIKIEKIIPYINNARTHSDEQVAQLAGSIREFGFTNPVLVDGSSNMIAGHGRVLAARKLGMDSVPAVVVTGLDDARRKALILADNKLALNAGWDDELLAAELKAIGGDAELTGFNDQEILELFDLYERDEDGLTDSDAIPDAQDAVVRLGDRWILGNHVLKCGDATNQADADALMCDVKADMVWTDPPYNVEYAGGTKDAMTICNDSMSDSVFRQFLIDAFTVAFNSTKPGCPMYAAHADLTGGVFRSAFELSGFNLKQCIIWVKSHMVLGRQDYQSQHEPILYGWKPGEAHKWYGNFDKKTVIDDDVNIKDLDKKQLVQLINEFRNNKNSTIIREQRPTVSDLHPTMKPVALVQRMVHNSSREGGVVLDLFGGSGSTMIACEKSNRCARLMELDPVYATVIINRWQDFTGKEATLESTGETFNALSEKNNTPSD